MLTETVTDLTEFRTAAAEVREALDAVRTIEGNHRQQLDELGGQSLYDSYYARRAAALVEDRDAWMADNFPEDTAAVKAIETLTGVTHHARQTQNLVAFEKLRLALVALGRTLGRELLEAKEAHGSLSVLELVDEQFARANALFASEFPMLNVRVVAEFNGEFATTFYKELAPRYEIDPSDKRLVEMVRAAAANEIAAPRMI